MAKPGRRKNLTPLETLIMDSLWRRSPASVREVQESLHAVKPMAYTTVLTLMRRLRDTGYLASERSGRADLYRPQVSRRQTARGRLRELLDRFFAGSPAELVSQLLDTERIDPDELRTIRREIDQRLDEQDKA